MAYKTNYERYIEQTEKRVPGFLTDFEYIGRNVGGVRIYKNNLFSSSYTFRLQLSDTTEIHLYPEEFKNSSGRLFVNRWNVVLWVGKTIKKHVVVYDENDIQNTVSEMRREVE